MGFPETRHLRIYLAVDKKIRRGKDPKRKTAASLAFFFKKETAYSSLQAYK